MADRPGRPRGHRRRRQRLRHRPRRRRARPLGAARRAGRSRAGDLVGLDQALPRRPALSRVLRVPAGARVADRARDAAARHAAHLLAAALRAAAPRGPRPAWMLRLGLFSTTTSAGGSSCRRPARSTWRATRPARRCSRASGGASNTPTAGSTTRGWWCCRARRRGPRARRSCTRTRFERAEREGDGWRVRAGRRRRGAARGRRARRS